MIDSSARAWQPWDATDYQRIVGASFADGYVDVRFADGGKARVETVKLIPDERRRPDWSSVTHEDFHLRVPSPAGEIEIPWDVIRVHSDPRFGAYWERVAAALPPTLVSISGAHE